jgi:hypothetical protein
MITPCLSFAAVVVSQCIILQLQHILKVHLAHYFSNEKKEANERDDDEERGENLFVPHQVAGAHNERY